MSKHMIETIMLHLRKFFTGKAYGMTCSPTWRLTIPCAVAVKIAGGGHGKKTAPGIYGNSREDYGTEVSCCSAFHP
jgi:hypothetical protein